MDDKVKISALVGVIFMIVSPALYVASVFITSKVFGIPIQSYWWIGAGFGITFIVGIFQAAMKSLSK